jgi:hypothetical protein
MQGGPVTRALLKMSSAKARVREARVVRRGLEGFVEKRGANVVDYGKDQLALTSAMTASGIRQDGENSR